MFVVAATVWFGRVFSESVRIPYLLVVSVPVEFLSVFRFRTRVLVGFCFGRSILCLARSSVLPVADTAASPTRCPRSPSSLVSLAASQEVQHSRTTTKFDLTVLPLLSPKKKVCVLTYSFYSSCSYNQFFSVRPVTKKTKKTRRKKKKKNRDKKNKKIDNNKGVSRGCKSRRTPFSFQPSWVFCVVFSFLLFLHRLLFSPPSFHFTFRLHLCRQQSFCD